MIFLCRCSVILIITFWGRIFFYKYNYFLSFGAGNFVSNSSFNAWKIIRNILAAWGLTVVLSELWPIYTVRQPSRVPTRHGKPGKLQFYFPGLENSWNLRKMPKLMEKIFVNKKMLCCTFLSSPCDVIHSSTILCPVYAWILSWKKSILS